MTRILTLAASTGLVAILAACAPPPSGGASTGAGGISQSAGENACRAALADFHSVDDVRIVSSEPYQGGGRFARGSVIANFQTGKRELWQCIAYADGSTGEISYLGDDPDTAGGGADPEVAAQDACRQPQCQHPRLGVLRGRHPRHHRRRAAAGALAVLRLPRRQHRPHHVPRRRGRALTAGS